jgi:hypothetical protein
MVNVTPWPAALLNDVLLLSPLAASCIADVLNFPDYAAELLEYLTLKYGNDKKYNFADQIIELLAQIPGQVEAELGAWPVVARIRDYTSRSTLQKYGL